MCGVGTAGHEFGHALGLPDMYDTDYDNYNGEAGGTYMYDIMCSGAYNNSGCTPPYYTAEERLMLGWMGSIDEISAIGQTYTLQTIDKNAAYKAASSNSGEYFLFEARSGKGWDAAVEPGFLIYHIDKSQNIVKYNAYSSTTAYNLWNNWSSYGNAINENGSHPCGYLIPSSDPANLNFSGTAAGIVFPGTSNVTAYVPIDWNEGSIAWYVKDISYDSSAEQAVFTLADNSISLTGTVRNSSGEPIEGAVVALYAASGASSVPAKSISSDLGELNMMKVAASASSSGSPLYTCVTAADGSYAIDLSSCTLSSLTAEASAEGYFAASRTVSVGNSVIIKNFVLISTEEEELGLIKKYTLESDTNIYGLGLNDNYPDTQVGVGWTGNELETLIGRRIDYISFCVRPEYEEPLDSTTLYAILDFGSTRKLTVKVEGAKIGWNTVDIRSYNIRIPENTTVYAGYGIDNTYSAHAYPYEMLFTKEAVADGGFYYGIWSSSASGWYSYSGGNALINMSLAPTVPDMDYLGYNYIYNPGSGIYTLGDNFALSLITSSSRMPAGVEWYFDDEPVTSDSITLDEVGVHLVKAILTLSNGQTKTLELSISVE